MADFSEYGVPSAEWEAIAATLPPPAKTLSLEGLREPTNATREESARTQMVSLISEVTLADHTITTRDNYALEARTYRPTKATSEESLPIYIHFHGGGFYFGTLSSEDAICSRIAINTGVVVLNVNYRHAPEHPYPVAWNDSEDALNWAAQHSETFKGDKTRIIVGGISAGGWLSAALTLTNLRRDQANKVNIIGQVLMIPATVFYDCRESQLKLLKDPGVSSYMQNEFAPILSLERIKQFNGLLHITHPDPDDIRLNPGLATPEDVQNLPPTTFGIAGSDPLRDEGLLYAKYLTENG